MRFVRVKCYRYCSLFLYWCFCGFIWFLKNWLNIEVIILKYFCIWVLYVYDIVYYILDIEKVIGDNVVCLVKL